MSEFLRNLPIFVRFVEQRVQSSKSINVIHQSLKQKDHNLIRIMKREKAKVSSLRGIVKKWKNKFDDLDKRRKSAKEGNQHFHHSKSSSNQRQTSSEEVRELMETKRELHHTQQLLVESKTKMKLKSRKFNDWKLATDKLIIKLQKFGVYITTISSTNNVDGNNMRYEVSRASTVDKEIMTDSSYYSKTVYTSTDPPKTADKSVEVVKRLKSKKCNTKPLPKYLSPGHLKRII